MKYKEIIEKMTLEDKVAFCSGADFWTTKAFEQYGIPSVFMTDGPHGLRKQAEAAEDIELTKSVAATCFPTASATACSWDRALLREMGEALGEEALQEQVAVVLGPGVNIKRNPLCGRNFEYFSEDPYLGGEMAESWINGVQSKGIGVSLKHFAGNNQENKRMSSDSLIDERTLREIYLPAFEKAVREAKPATVMCAYNKLNGIFCSDHLYLLKDILRDEWGFDGVIVTDWGAMNDRIKAFKASLDLEMPGSRGYFDQQVISAIKNGGLPEERLDECVDRLLTLVFAANNHRKTNYQYDANEHHNLAKKIAANSAVLLKNNDHVLPIHKGKKIALIGALAKEPRYQGAGSSYINPTKLSSAIDGFEVQGLNYTYFPGYPLRGTASETLLQEAVAGAKESDIAVVFAGLTEDYESEGFDRTDLGMPKSHNELIASVAAANPNTVVVLVGGAPVEMPWLPKVKAVLNMYLAGQAGGLAAVELLTGVVNPSGKLAESYPIRYEDVPSAGFFEEGGRQAQYREGIYVGYRYYDKAKIELRFPFGYGLSYTTFEYSDLMLSRTEMQDTDELTVTVTVKNTGNVDGAEVVQLYVSDFPQAVFRPQKELKGFAKVFLKTGEEKQVSFSLNFRSFACYDASARSWIVPDGEYGISIAASSRDIRLQEKVRVHGTPVKTEPSKIALWYTSLSGKATSADFESILGRRIEEVKQPRKGEYNLSCTLRDMEESSFVKWTIKSLKRNLAKQIGEVDYDDPNYKLMMEIATNIPLKNLVLLSSKDMPVNVAQGIVHMANGNYIKGIIAMLRKKQR